MLLMRQGKLALAEQEFVQIMELATEHLGAEHPYVMIFSNNYGECLTRMKRYGEAEAMLLRTHAALSKSMGADNARTVKARTRLTDLYDQSGRPESAAKWRGPVAG